MKSNNPKSAKTYSPLLPPSESHCHCCYFNSGQKSITGAIFLLGSSISSNKNPTRERRGKKSKFCGVRLPLAANEKGMSFSDMASLFLDQKCSLHSPLDSQIVNGDETITVRKPDKIR
ncbi:hypothetical protein ACLOJK_019072 [Asimina triloba]